MTHRYTYRRSRGFVAGGTCGICGRTYTEKACPYCTTHVMGFLAVALLFLPALLGAN